MKTHRDYVIEDIKPILEKFDLKGDVLEIGPGMDREIRTFLEGFGLKYFGVDNWRGVNNKDEYQIGGEYEEAMMENLPYGDETFDIVFACHSFEHTEQPSQSLREFHRVLKKGGLCFIITPFPCVHQILQADYDHINVLSDMQMIRLFAYTNFVGVQSVIPKVWSRKEQDWNVISWGRKQ